LPYETEKFNEINFSLSLKPYVLFSKGGIWVDLLENTQSFKWIQMFYLTQDYLLDNIPISIFRLYDTKELICFNMYLVSFQRITLWASKYQLLQYSLSVRMCEWNWEWKLRVGLNFINFVCGFITTLQGNKITSHAFFSTRSSLVKHQLTW
jgi:hypothetical protein